MNCLRKIVFLGAFYAFSCLQGVHGLETLEDRVTDYFNVRSEAALFQIYQQPDIIDPASGLPSFDIYEAGNGDEKKIPNFAASYTKGFEHDAVTGLVTQAGAASFNQMVVALESSSQADFNAIVLAGARKLVSPQTALMYSLQGRPITLFPGFVLEGLQTAESAAQLIEVQLQAIMRHVKFEEYGTGLGTDSDGAGGSKALKACAILNRLGDAFQGPRDSSTGTVTPRVLFRGISSGVLTGPYQSQFALHDVSPLFSYNTVPHSQFVPEVSATEFGVSWDDFIAIENGNIPRPYGADKSILNGRFFGPAKRHIIMGSDFSTMFHEDGPCEAFYYATQILLNHGFPFNPDSPYSNGTITKEAPFVSMGPIEIFSVLAEASHEAIKTVWAYKWLAHRSIRPEVFAGLVHRAKMTGNNEFELHESLFDQELSDWIIAYNKRQSDLGIVPDDRDRLSLEEASTYLLSQQYPEASPLHPSFLSGHASIAGACATVLKAYFNGDTKISDFLTPVKPSSDGATLIPLSDLEGAKEMTVNSELHKLASNACLGSRNFAGIHYRRDADRGCELGEAVAIQWLIDQARKHNEDTFTGFSITKFNGAKIRITKNGVTSGAKP